MSRFALRTDSAHRQRGPAARCCPARRLVGLPGLARYVAWRQGAPRDRRLRAGCQSHRQRALPFRRGSHREDRLGRRRARHRCGDGFRRALIVRPVASPTPQAELTKAPGHLARRPCLPSRLPFTVRLFGEEGSWRLAPGEPRAWAEGMERRSVSAGDAVSPSPVSLVTVGVPLVDLA
jgi:hypothetical protein